MQILKFETLDEWMLARRCRITGSRLEDITEKKRGVGKKIGFYELIAERIALPPTDESPMDRGHRLEEEAMDRFEAMTGKTVNRELVLWARDENPNIAVSPDGSVDNTEAVEVKCLASARHIEAFLTKTIPDEYQVQAKQYFIVNPELEVVNVCFYDPRLKVCDFFILEVHRHHVLEEIDALLEHEKMVLAEVEQIVADLTKF